MEIKLKLATFPDLCCGRDCGGCDGCGGGDGQGRVRQEEEIFFRVRVEEACFILLVLAAGVGRAK